jgi:hypothetical protein
MTTKAPEKFEDLDYAMTLYLSGICLGLQGRPPVRAVLEEHEIAALDLAAEYLRLAGSHLADRQTGTGEIIMGEVAIKCRLCGRVSHNPNDVKNRYCGNCHHFHEGPSATD